MRIGTERLVEIRDQDIRLLEEWRTREAELEGDDRVLVCESNRERERRIALCNGVFAGTHFLAETGMVAVAPTRIDQPQALREAAAGESVAPENVAA